MAWRHPILSRIPQAVTGKAHVTWAFFVLPLASVGLGGCGPYGLALAAHKRGFLAEIWVNDPGVQMIDSVRSAEKKAVMALVQGDMEREIRELGIAMHLDVLDAGGLEAAFERGAVAGGAAVHVLVLAGAHL